MEAGVGATYFVSPNIGIEAILSYKSFDFNADKTAGTFSEDRKSVV